MLSTHARLVRSVLFERALLLLAAVPLAHLLLACPDLLELGRARLVPEVVDQRQQCLFRAEWALPKARRWGSTDGVS